MPELTYRHILTKTEIAEGRLNISAAVEDEFMRVFAAVRDKPFNVFSTDGKCLNRNARFQKLRNGLRFNCGQHTFVDCRQGTNVWLHLNRHNDIEVQVSDTAGPLSDPELQDQVLPILENPHQDDYADAVIKACVILESRLKIKSCAPKGSDHGKGLADYALETKNAAIRLRSDGREQNGFYYLYLGISGAFRNPLAHGNDAWPRNRARQVVGIVDLLLGEIKAAMHRERPKARRNSGLATRPDQAGHSTSG